MLTTTKTQYSIQEAGKACDLNPSVLRIWEARYGWPKPTRRDNGYRIYDVSQVDELKRVAELVRSGHAISSLIQNGQPALPSQSAPPENPFARLDQLPMPTGSQAQGTWREMLTCLRRQQFGSARGLVERANWALHPRDLPLACFVPALVTLAEVWRLPAPLADSHITGQHLLRDTIIVRCRELLRSQPANRTSLAILPLCPEDQALAWVAALMLSQNGQTATVITQQSAKLKSQKLLTVSDQVCPLPGSLDSVGHVSAVVSEHGIALTELTSALRPARAASHN